MAGPGDSPGDSLGLWVLTPPSVMVLGQVLKPWVPPLSSLCFARETLVVTSSHFIGRFFHPVVRLSLAHAVCPPSPLQHRLGCREHF